MDLVTASTLAGWLKKQFKERSVATKFLLLSFVDSAASARRISPIAGLVWTFVFSLNETIHPVRMTGQVDQCGKYIQAFSVFMNSKSIFSTFPLTRM